ncbi:MAG: response regulator [Anaerolineales bacterium]|nr:response regulator [Anaerolineales bacterium]
MARILVVDDEQTTRDLLSQVIRLLGHEPLVAEGGAQALQCLDENPPDLVLLDLMMPEMDGYETMRHMRSREAGSSLPIIVITASQELDVEERATDAGADEVYFKPIGVSAISEIVGSFTESTVSDTAPLQ